MLQINKYFHKILANLSRFEISLILLGILITTPISFLSWNINQSLTLQATNQIDTLLISPDVSKAHPNLSTVVIDPSSSLEKNIDQIIDTSNQLETSPFQNFKLENEKDRNTWKVINPKNNQNNSIKSNLEFNLSYKLKPSTIIEVKYNKEKEELNFVLPEVKLAISGNNYLINRSTIATINNLSSSKVLYLSDYEGLNLENYKEGKFINFKDLVDNNIFIYSKSQVKTLFNQNPGESQKCDIDPISNKYETDKDKNDSGLERTVCFSKNFDYDFKLQSKYLFSFDLTSSKFDYLKYNLKIAEFISQNISDNNKAVSQSVNKNILVKNTTNFDQIVTIKNPNLKTLQFSLIAIEDWQNLKLSLGSLNLTELKFDSLANIKPAFDKNLVIDRDTKIQLKSGENEILAIDSTVKDLKINNQNTALSNCDLNDFSPTKAVSKNLANNINYYNYDSNNIKINAFCQAFITNFFADPSFFYNLEININSAKYAFVQFETNFLNSENTVKSKSLKPGQNRLEFVIDPYNIKGVGTIFKIIKNDKIDLDLTSLTLNKGLPKNLDSFIFSQSQSDFKTIPGVIVANSNNLFSSNFNVKFPQDSSTVKTSKMIVKTSAPTPLFTTLKSDNKETNIQSFIDYYGNQVWLISCSSNCEEVKLNLFNPILIFQKLSLFFFILLTLFYIGCKLFLIENYTQISSSLKNIVFKFNKFSSQEVSKLKTKIIKLENYVLLHKWLIAPLVLAILACLYLTVGLRITFIFLALIIFLRFKTSAKIIASLGAAGAIAMIIVSLISKLPIINNNSTISKYINQGLSNDFGIYSYYLIAIAVFIFALNWYKEQNEETKSA